MNTATLATKPDRCQHGWHPTQATIADCACHTADEWHTFTAALRQATRDDGTVHACDVRPLVRDVMEPKHIGLAWRRARREGLVVEVGHERSDDERGRNAGRMEPYYELRTA